MLGIDWNMLTISQKNPSVSSFFKPSLEKTVKEPRLQVACKHLHGSKYDKYILRTETRTLGSVSPQLHARVVHQILHYKKHPTLRVSARLDGADLFKPSKTPRIPEGGNDMVPGRGWTPVEQRKIDDVLKKWACWEVNYVHKFVRSSECEGMTINWDKICDLCKELAGDESLKRFMRRVGTFN
jgi:hypothetical protein